MNNIKEYYGSIKSAYNAICTKRDNHNEGMEEQCGCIYTVLKNCPKYNKVLFNSPLCKEAYNNILNINSLKKTCLESNIKISNIKF